MLTAVELLHRYLDPYPGLFDLVYGHSRLVADKALVLAAAQPSLGVDVVLLEEAALLHDIGVFKTHAPSILCYGDKPYLCHGVEGRIILEAEGMPMQALVCERHIGTGLTLEEIVSRNLPLPHRDMQPKSMEEILVCFADLFFSKSRPGEERSPASVRADLERYGAEGVARFDGWCRRFL